VRQLAHPALPKSAQGLLEFARVELGLFMVIVDLIPS